MRNYLFALQVPQRVLQLDQLDEEIVFRIQARRCHRRFEVEAEPFLNPEAAQLRRALCQVEEEHQIEDDRRRKNRVAAQEVHLDLHRVAEPSEDVDVVPTFFVIATRRVIVDTNFVEDIAIELRIQSGLQNVFERSELRFFLGLERAGIVQHLAVAIAQDVGGIPSAYPEQPRLEGGSEHGLYQSLASLEIFAANWNFALA